MALAITPCPLHRLCVLLCVFLLVPLSAYPQTTLTGAVQFSTNSAGATSGPWVWNTLAGDSYWDLWLALNPDATSPVNGPSDAQAGISIPLDASQKYRFYLFGSGSCCTSFNGLNLFFDGNDSVPGISVFGATNSSDFLANGNSTLTLAGEPVAGSGSTVYNADGVVVVLDGYEWHTPQTPPGDVCQALLFSPGDGPDYFGSFTLQVFPEPTFSIGQPSGSPGTRLSLTGSGFTPAETVTIYAGRIGSPPLSSPVTDASGSFTVTLREPQHPYGAADFFAVGQTSGKLGIATLVVTPAWS